MLSAAVVLLAVAFPDEPPKEKPDIACELSGMYIGNAINPVFKLKIEGPKTKRWSYSMRDDMFGFGARADSYIGTYEIDGGLVVFTGEQAGKEPKPLKFALNYGFPDGKVAFDRMFPAADGTFTYHRKWFRLKGKEWQPAEEQRLSLKVPKGDWPEKFDLTWKGERVLWDTDGKRTVLAVDVTMSYTRTQTDCYALAKPAEAKWEWLPAELLLDRVKEKLVSLTWRNRAIGDLRGFSPTYAHRAAP